MPPKRQNTQLRLARNEKALKASSYDRDIASFDDLGFFAEDELTEGSWVPGKEKKIHLNSDWEDSSESERDDNDDVEMTDNDEAEFDIDAFTMLMKAGKFLDNFAVHKVSYSRGPQHSKRHKRRNAQKHRELAASAHGSRPLTAAGFFTQKSTPLIPSPSDGLDSSPSDLNPNLDNISSSDVISYISPETHIQTQRSKAIQNLEGKIRSKKTNLHGQNLTRHRAVLNFLKLQVKFPERTREQAALQVAECLGRGLYMARKIVKWERQWVSEKQIEEGQQGCHIKSRSWFNDEGVQIAVRESIASSGDKLTAQRIAQVVGEYLGSEKATTTVQNILTESIALSGPVILESLNTSRGLKIRLRTARKWLKCMGFYYGTVSKNVYIDGHEREDVVKYRQDNFLPAWAKLAQRMVIFSEDGTWTLLLGLQDGKKPLVLVTHDESTFNANDGKRHIWMEKGKTPLRPKGRGKGIMISEFLTPGGRLHVPDSVSDDELLQNSG